MTFRESYELKDVFTPTKPARFTFVERQSVNDRLVAALETPGKQIVVYGYSGCGKTTLLVNKLHQVYENHITTRCYSGLTFEQLMRDAFDRLSPFYDSERMQVKKTKVSSSVQINYLGIKGQLAADSSNEGQTKQVRVLPPQLTPQNLAIFLGDAHCCWVLDDFHKIDSREKVKMAQVMKLFMDMADTYPELKIIAIGAVDTARQVIQCDPEMDNRVSEVFVPLMTEAEISEIPDRGEELLNFALPPDIKHQVVKFSDGLASVCHQLCLNICFAAEIRRTVEPKIEISQNVFDRALEQYVEESSDTLKVAFDKAFRQSHGQTINDGKVILRALLKCNQEGATKEEVLSKIKRKQPEYKMLSLNTFLKQLQSADRGELIRYDQASGRYSFSENIYRAYAATYFEREQKKEKTAERTVDVDPEDILRQLIRGIFDGEHSSQIMKD